LLFPKVLGIDLIALTNKSEATHVAVFFVFSICAIAMSGF
jgi:hypothetical protein